jgi:hypothetical protein
LSEADRKENRFPKAELPVNITEEKHKSLEPQIQFLYKCIAELPETDRIIISLNSKSKAGRNSQDCRAF